MSEKALKAILRRSVVALSTHSGAAAIWRRCMPKHAIRILAYHAIEAEPSSHFAVATQRFAAHMRWLVENYRPIALDAVWDHIERGSPIADGAVAVTFDDGFENFLSNAMPILERHAIPATCFVIGSKIDSGDAAYLSRQQICQLSRSGLITIGSHSMSHRSIREATPAERIHELAASKACLEQAIGSEVKYFCYPYGTRNDFDDNCAEILRDAGYKMALTSINGVNTARSHRFFLRRTKIEAGDDETTFRGILRGGIDAWYLVDLTLSRFQKRRRHSFR